jgi:hypothetical protein
MPPAAQFFSYNIASNNQVERLQLIRQPLFGLQHENPSLFTTWALNQNVNNQTRTEQRITARHDIEGSVIEVDPAGEDAQPGRRRRRRSDASSNSDFHVLPPARRRRRHDDPVSTPIEKRLAFIAKRASFKQKWNKAFPDEPCVECGTLLLPRHRKTVTRRLHHVYGITRVFSIAVDEPLVVLCKTCFKNPQSPIDVGEQPACIASLPLRSTKFLSPFQLDTNLGRTCGYNTSAIPFTYRTQTGKMAWRTQNPRAIALYSGVLGAWLESSRHNRYDRDHDVELLERCRDWLLENNPVFQRHDVQANIQVPDPLPLIQLINDHRQERRPANRPDIVLDPHQYDPETRNEDFRYHRLPVGHVVGLRADGNLPLLFRWDRDVEVLLFPHLYPFGRGQWVEQVVEAHGRREYTYQMDVKRKLNSVNPVFRNDWYYPGYAYQEMESRRIHQNNFRLVNNRTRQAIDRRLPHHQLLQQSNYGTFSVVNEALTTVIPASIRTSETYFHEKKSMLNSLVQASGLPSLFITLTFNERSVRHTPCYINITVPYNSRHSLFYTVK